MASNFGHNDWMSKLEDQVPLNYINFVGTYNSGETSPLEKLNRGFRFFHVVLTSDGSFPNAIKSIGTFLENWQTECVIVLIKRQLGPKAQAQASQQDLLTIFQKIFQDQPDIREKVFYPANRSAYETRLFEARGKMILLADNDLQLGYAFDSPLTTDPNTFWPVNICTQLTSLPKGDPKTDPGSWTGDENRDVPWNKVNGALQLAKTRDSIKTLGLTQDFTNNFFFQLWLVTENTATASGNEAVIDFFYEGISQVITHAVNSNSGPQDGLKLFVGLIVFDNDYINQDVITRIINANPSLRA